MTWELDLFVAGAPQTKGNLTGFRMGTRIKLTEKSGEAQRLWAAYVHDAAVQAWRELGQPGPSADAVSVQVDFVMPRRKTAPKRRTDPHTRKPDGDKITRCVWDAMTGVVYLDDAQIVEWGGSKREAEIGETPGARIRVRPWRPVVRPALVSRVTIESAELIEANLPGAAALGAAMDDMLARQMARALQPGPGEDDAKVWIPPVEDCVGPHPDGDCPHCGGLYYHARTRRCSTCGRRP